MLKKNKILILLLFISFLVKAQEIKGRVCYQIFSQKSKLHDSLGFQEYNKFRNHRLGLRDKMIFNLDFSNKESLYYFDSKRDIGISGDKQYNSLLKSFANSRYYMDLEENILIKELVSEKLFLLSSKLDDLEWDIKKESKNIGDYKCFKAMSVKKVFHPMKGVIDVLVVAWFSPEISVPFGPKGFSGLPGLILEVTQGKLTYYASSIELNKKENFSIIRPSRGLKMTQKEYDNKSPVMTEEELVKQFGGR